MGVEHARPPEPIEKLIERARAPDSTAAMRQAAFGIIVERYQDAAYGYALTVLGDPQLARDAAQEAFLIAYCALEQLRAPDAFPGWLRRIVRTCCRRLRREYQSPMTSLDALDQLGASAELDDVQADSQLDPAIVAEAREARAALAAAVDALPDAQRLVTILFYLIGFPQHEIARFLNVPLTTVKKRLQAARKHLHARMLTFMDDEALQHYGRAYLPSQTERVMHTVLLLAAFDDDSGRAVLDLLLIDGLDVNTRDRDGRTLLSWAAQRGQLEAAVFLLRQGAELNARDRTGTTALAWAERAHRPDVAIVLSQLGGVR